MISLANSILSLGIQRGNEDRTSIAPLIDDRSDDGTILLLLAIGSANHPSSEGNQLYAEISNMSGQSQKRWAKLFETGYTLGYFEGGKPVATSLANPTKDKLRDLSLALLQYQQDNGGALTPLSSTQALAKLLTPYLANHDSLTDPLNKLPFIPNDSLAAANVYRVVDAKNIIAVYEPQPSNSLRYVLYLDGNIAQLTTKQWVSSKIRSNIK